MKSNFSNNSKQFSGADLAKNVKRSIIAKTSKTSKKPKAGKKAGGSELVKNVK